MLEGLTQLQNMGKSGMQIDTSITEVSYDESGTRLITGDSTWIYIPESIDSVGIFDIGNSTANAFFATYIDQLDTQNASYSLAAGDLVSTAFFEAVPRTAELYKHLASEMPAIEMCIRGTLSRRYGISGYDARRIRSMFSYSSVEKLDGSDDLYHCAIQFDTPNPVWCKIPLGDETYVILALSRKCAVLYKKQHATGDGWSVIKFTYPDWMFEPNGSEMDYTYPNPYDFTYRLLCGFLACYGIIVSSAGFSTTDDSVREIKDYSSELLNCFKAEAIVLTFDDLRQAIKRAYYG